MIEKGAKQPSVCPDDTVLPDFFILMDFVGVRHQMCHYWIIQQQNVFIIFRRHFRLVLIDGILINNNENSCVSVTIATTIAISYGKKYFFLNLRLVSAKLFPESYLRLEGYFMLAKFYKRIELKNIFLGGIGSGELALN